jgi:hypothetical protein
VLETQAEEVAQASEHPVRRLQVAMGNAEMVLRVNRKCVGAES